MRNKIEYNGWEIEYLGNGIFKYQDYSKSCTLYNIYTKQANNIILDGWCNTIDWANEAELQVLRKLMFQVELEAVLRD